MQQAKSLHRTWPEYTVFSGRIQVTIIRAQWIQNSCSTLTDFAAVAQEFLFIGNRLKTFEAAAWPPLLQVAPNSRTNGPNDAQFIANVLLFSVVGNARLVSCDRQLSFLHCNIKMEPSPFLLSKFPASSMLAWQKRQVTNLLIFFCSLSPATIAWPWSFCHVSVFSRSARDFSTVIFNRLVWMWNWKPTRVAFGA